MADFVIAFTSPRPSDATWDLILYIIGSALLGVTFKAKSDLEYQ